MSIEFPSLPYADDALEPHVSAETLSFHHGKHHRAYVDKLNAAIAGTEYAGKSLETIIAKSYKADDKGVFNNSAQAWNHTFLWHSMSPNGGGDPTGPLADAIAARFGDLAGFRAEAYTVELQDAYSEARQIMDRQILRDVKFDIGGDRQRIHNIDTDVKDVTFKHILLPVWLAAYKYRGETYRFVVNGRTGRVQGERPWSAIKIAIAVVLGLIVAGVAGYFIAQSQ